MGNSCGIMGPKVLPDFPCISKSPELDYVNHEYYNKLYQDTIHREHKEKRKLQLQESAESKYRNNYACRRNFEGHCMNGRTDSYNEKYKQTNDNVTFTSYKENPMFSDVNHRYSLPSDYTSDVFYEVKNRPFYARRRVTSNREYSPLDQMFDKNPNITLREMGFENFILSSPVNSKLLNKSFKEQRTNIWPEYR